MSDGVQSWRPWRFCLLGASPGSQRPGRYRYQQRGQTQRAALALGPCRSSSTDCESRPTKIHAATRCKNGLGAYQRATAAHVSVFFEGDHKRGFPFGSNSHATSNRRPGPWMVCRCRNGRKDKDKKAYYLHWDSRELRLRYEGGRGDAALRCYLSRKVRIYCGERSGHETRGVLGSIILGKISLLA